jgi:hypothetical protein
MKRGTMAKAVVVHDLGQAEAALAAAAALKQPIAIWSPPDAALRAGVGWFAALARQARAAAPKAKAAFILDCGDRADLVQDAFRDGLADACFTGRPAVAARLTDIARKSKARLHLKRPRALDLAKDLAKPGDIAAALEQLLAGN